jgi:hypothetical protein
MIIITKSVQLKTGFEKEPVFLRRVLIKTLKKILILAPK